MMTLPMRQPRCIGHRAPTNRATARSVNTLPLNATSARCDARICGTHARPSIRE
jgi:hypothetical protein